MQVKSFSIYQNPTQQDRLSEKTINNASNMGTPIRKNSQYKYVSKQVDSSTE